jgi:hypothetical protein
MSSKLFLPVLAAMILIAPVALAGTASVTSQEGIVVTPPLLDQAPIATCDDSDTIDQNQPVGNIYIANFSQTGVAQSFQQTHDNISGAGILLQADVGSTGTVNIQLWTGLPNAGGSKIAEGTTTGTAGTWVDVYWSPTTVTLGTTYYLIFEPSTNGLGIAGTTNVYPHGIAYANAGYGAWPAYDYAFRTYYRQYISLERTTWAEVKTLF